MLGFIFISFFFSIGADSCRSSLINTQTGQLNAQSILTRPRLSFEREIELAPDHQVDVRYDLSHQQLPHPLHQKDFPICWICAGVNSLYFYALAKGSPKPPAFSAKYYYFFHLLEQVNFHLHGLAEAAVARDEIIPQDIELSHSGTFQKFLYLVSRYGLVYHENYASLPSVPPTLIEKHLRHLIAIAYLRFHEVAKEAKKNGNNVSKRVAEERETWTQNTLHTLEYFFGKIPLPPKIISVSEHKLFSEFVSPDSWQAFRIRNSEDDQPYIRGLLRVVGRPLPRDLPLYYFRWKRVKEMLERIEKSLEQGMPVIIDLRMAPEINLDTGHLQPSILLDSKKMFGWESLPTNLPEDGYFAKFQTTEQTHALVLFDQGRDTSGKRFYLAMNSWGMQGDRGMLHIEEDYLLQYLLHTYIRTEVLKK